MKSFRIVLAVVITLTAIACLPQFAWAAANDAQFVSQSVPQQMSGGEIYQVSVTMKNTGTANWTVADNYKLGTPDNNLTWGSNRAPVESNEVISPGMTKTFIFTVRAPKTPGTYNFQWQMVKEFVEWFGELTPTVAVTVTAGTTNNSQFISQTITQQMTAGQTYQASITMNNIGTASWTNAGNYKLGTPDNNLIFGTNRVLLGVNETIDQGNQKTFTFNVTAPQAPGTYNFQWRMVREFVEWFGNTTQNVSIIVSSAPTSINIKDYGAKGDGITDDSSAIQSAIDAVAPGGTITIPAGTYMLGTSAGGVETFPDGTPIQSALIVNKNNVVIKGDGANTVLKLMPSRKMRVISVTSSGVVIEQLAVDGNKSQRYGSVPWPNGDVVDALVYGSSSSSNITVRFCEVRNGIEDGIGFWQSSNSSVHDCITHNNGTTQAGGAGVSVAGANNNGGRVINNKILSNTAAGIWLGFGSSNILVEGNTIEKNLGAGITTGGDSPTTTVLSTDITIKNNVLRENGPAGFPAIAIYSAQNGIISGNTITDNIFDGLSFNDQGSISSSGWTVEDNICSNTNNLRNQDFGIRVLGLSKNITIRNNTCRDNGTFIGHQIVVDNASAVVNNWQTDNTLSYSSLISTPPPPPPPAATPTFSPTGGSFTGAVTVTITSATPEAEIHYTTNGNPPTTSSALYTGPVTLLNTTTLQALARKMGMTDSAVASATYTLVPPPPPTVSLTASPSSITSGQSAMLTWSSTNATSCTASGGWEGTKALAGSQSVSPTAMTIYTLSCTGAGGTQNHSAIFTVTALSPPRRPSPRRQRSATPPMGARRARASTPGR